MALINRGGLENICKDDKLSEAICKVHLSDLKAREKHCYTKADNRKIKLKDNTEETCLKVSYVLEFFPLGKHAALIAKIKCKIDAFFNKTNPLRNVLEQNYYSSIFSEHVRVCECVCV